jgi:hypothetical protein
VLAAATVATAQAHHSTAMFDRTRTIELTGVVKEFQWTNPHVWLQVSVANAAGTAAEWSIEGGGPNQLARQGWRPATFVPGETVTLVIYPMADGANGGAFVGAKFADGRTLGRTGN